MPQIPQYVARNTPDGSLGIGSVDTGSQLIAKGISALAGGIRDFATGQLAVRDANEKKIERDSVLSADLGLSVLETKTLSEMNRLQLNRKRGDDPFTPQVLKFYDDGLETVNKNASTPEAQGLVARRSAETRQRLFGEATKWEAGQGVADRASDYEDKISQSSVQVANNPQDYARLKADLEDTLVVADLDPDTDRKARDMASQRLAAAAVDALIMKDPNGVKKALQSGLGESGIQAIEDLNKNGRDAALRVADTEIKRREFDVRSAAAEIETARLRGQRLAAEKAYSIVEQEINRIEKEVPGQLKTQMLEAAWTKVPAALWESMSPADRNSMRNLSLNRTTDTKGWDKYYAIYNNLLSRDSGVAKDAASENLMETAMPYMAPDQFNALVALQKGILAGNKEANLAIVGVQSQTDKVKAALAGAGIDTSAAAKNVTGPVSQRAINFRQMIDSDVARFGLENGVRPNDIQLDAIIDRRAQDLVYSDVPWGSDTIQPLASLSAEERANAYVTVDGKDYPLSTVPKNSYEKILVTLKKNKIPPTWQAVMEMYVKGQNK